jgi:hypothetical protein
MWIDRRVGTDTKPANWFEANEKNFRTHPMSQGAAFVSVVKSVGLADAIKVNLRNSPKWEKLQGQPIVLNGHMRVMEALKIDENMPLPVDYYDFSPEEEELVLLSFDYLSKLAGTDRINFNNLFENVMSYLDRLEKDENLEGLLELMARENDIFQEKLDEELPDIDENDIKEFSDSKKGKAKLVVTCDVFRVEEIGNFLNSITGCEWSRKA